MQEESRTQDPCFPFSECIFLFVEPSPLTLIHGQFSWGFFCIQQILTGLGMSAYISIALNPTEFPVPHCLMLILVARGPVFTVSRHSVVVSGCVSDIFYCEKTLRPKATYRRIYWDLQFQRLEFIVVGQSQQEQAWHLSLQKLRLHMVNYNTKERKVN